MIVCVIDNKQDKAIEANKVHEGGNESIRTVVNNENKRNKLTMQFWLFSFIITFANAATFPFLNISPGFLSSTYFKGHSKEKAAITAGRYFSVFLITAAVLLPIIGFISGRLNKKINLYLYASIFGIFSFLLLFKDLVSMSFISLALAYSIFNSNIWASIASVVDNDLYVNYYILIIIFRYLLLVLQWQ
jgi:hypothetical protein